MKKLRKFLTVGVMVLSIVAMSGLTVNTAKASAQAGDLIKMDGLSSVYYLSNDGKRYVFPSESVYFSWYSDFSGVVTIPASELQSYPLGANVTMRPGTKLVKITTDPSVYAVTPNGVLRKIQSEADAIALYGSNWASMVVDVADSFFTNYTIGTPLTSGMYPAGTLLKNANNASVYYFDGTDYRLIASEAALAANRLSLSNVVTTSMTLTASGTAITGMEDISKPYGTGNNVITSTGVQVSVSANTAVASSVVAGQALAEVGSFNFTASNDGVAIIKTLKLKRIGISADDSLSNVYLYEGNTRLTDGASFSNGYVSFSSTDLMTILAGQTKTLTVKADVAITATGNVGVAINAASDITASAATISGSFPLNSNLMSPTSATLATVALTNTMTSTTTPNYSAKAGNENTVVWSETANVGYKAVDLKYIAFKQIGSINSDDLANLSLYVDGTKVGTATLNNNDLSFDLATPSRLNTGNHTIELKADIIKGSSRTFSFSLQVAANMVVTDTNYNVNVVPTTTNSGILAAPGFTISTGTLSVSADTTFNATEIVKTASNAVLSKFKIKAFGEDVKVNSLGVNMTLTGDSIPSEAINDLSVSINGNQVGSSQTWSLATSTNATTIKTFGTNNLFTIPAGTEVSVEIKGSLSLDSSTSLTKIKADLGAISGQGVTSYSSVTSSTVSANNSLNIVTGSISTAKNSAVQNQNVSKNTQKVKIGSYIISAGSAEGVNVSNLKVKFTTNTTADYSNYMSNLYVSDNTTPVNPQASNDFNVDFNIAKNANKVIDVYADLGDLTNNDVIETSLTVTYKTDTTMTFGTGSETTGQQLTIKTASLADPTIVTNDPVAALVLGGTTASAAKYKMVATDGNAYVNELVFTVSGGAISQLTVDGVSAPVVGTTATITGLNKEIVSGLQGTNVDVVASYIPVTTSGQGGITSYATSNIVMTSMKYTVNGAQTTDSSLGSSVTSNSMKVVAAIPTIAKSADSPVGMSSGYLAGADSDLLHFTIANGSATNPINLDTITVTPTFSGTLTATSSQKIKIYNSKDLNTVLGEGAFVASGTKVKITFTADEVISSNSSETYVAKADTSGLTADGNSIRLSLTSADTIAALGSSAAGDWSWNDSTVVKYANGYLLKNLPVDGSTMVK